MSTETLVTITAANIRVLYADGRRDFQGADLSGADLSGADLSGADLSGANLNEAIFYAGWKIIKM